MNPQDEVVLIVDKNNNETGSAPRHEMRARGLPHRASYILVFNSRAELFVQKRTMTKDIYPGYYDVSLSVYDEATGSGGGEWDVDTVNGANVFSADTSQSFSGSKSILFSGATVGEYINLSTSPVLLPVGLISTIKSGTIP